ncbi:MAG TPA: GNAT family N-acetyltransferase [Gammaproteobacteria bacterium]|nr:GNAT family N-acetyltransferase [Gammaproteobacteria bacterium]
MRIVTCTYQSHAGAILAILNDAIVSSTALFDYAPRSAESMVEWFRMKAAREFPVIGAQDDDGALLGFATYGTFRAWPAYKYSVEHSVYVHRDHRRRGVALALMKRLIEVAIQQRYHTLVAGIEAANAPSITLHEKLGFAYVGTVRDAGFKFGRWVDLAFYQLLLPTPLDPRDG